MSAIVDFRAMASTTDHRDAGMLERTEQCTDVMQQQRRVPGWWRRPGFILQGRDRGDGEVRPVPADRDLTGLCGGLDAGAGRESAAA